MRPSERRRGRATGVAVLLAAFIAVGCSASPAVPSPASSGGPSPSADVSAAPSAAPVGDVELTFYYPVLVPGPITETFDTFIAEFEAANPSIDIDSIYSGSYDETTAKIQTQLRGGGEVPDVAIIGNQHTVTYVDMDAIVPLDSYIEEAGGAAFIDDFYPGFLENVRHEEQIWAIPFQRSTPVMYWNKTMFQEAGLDPEVGPKDLDELVDFAGKLTRPGVWGVQIPSDIDAWVIQAMTAANGTPWSTDSPAEVAIDTPAFRRTLSFLRDLSLTHGVMPEGVLPWGQQPTEFASGLSAITLHTTGSLTNIKSQTDGKFDVGVGFLPAGDAGNSVITGGGNFAVFKQSTPEEQQAAWKFIEFMSQPDQMARWNVATGYVATRQSAWETDVMQDYLADVPEAAVARDQLQYAVKQMVTHELLPVTQAITQEIQAALVGSKSADDAAAAAQAAADGILADFR